MGFISEGFGQAVKSVIDECFFDEEGKEIVEGAGTGANRSWVAGLSVKIGDKTHPRNRIPIEHYDDFKKQYPGSKVFFRGPRKGAYDPVSGRHNRTMKSDATHFYVQDLKEGNNMAFVTKEFEGAVKSVIDDEFSGLTEEQLIQMAESFEAKLEKIRAKIAKKPKDEYDFEPEKPKAAKTTVTGTYGKSYTDLDDEGKEKVAAVQATQVKRGRGRPRGSKNI